MSNNAHALQAQTGLADIHDRHIQDDHQAFRETAESSNRSKARVYRVEDIAEMLCISLRAAYNLCNTTKEFRVFHIGSSIRIGKESFDAWFANTAQ